MVKEKDLSVGDFRNLETKLAVPIEIYSYTRVITTAADVIHSLAIPSLGLKIDAIPGRLNQQCILAKKIGNFYGQCSEICGANHRFMPISFEIRKKRS
jgi:cytochrome c oxidase subunit 2